MTLRSLVLALVLALLPATAPAQPFGGFGGGGADADTVALSAMEARSIGPAASSGRIGDIVGVPGSPDTLFVGAATGGVWRTVNGGTTWEPIFDEQRAGSVGAMAVHPRNHDVVWVGTGEASVRNSSGIGRGVWKSIDGGETWTFMGLEDSRRISKILVHPDDPEVAWVAAQGPLWTDGGQRGVYRTTDGGETWEQVLAGPNPTTGVGDMVMDPDNPEKIFAALWQHRRWPYFFKSGGPGSGLYVTHDGGESWEQVTEEDGFLEGPLGKIGLAVAPSNPEVVYALTEARDNALLRSDDGGESWRVVNREEGIGDRPFYYQDIQVDPSNPDRVYHVAGDLRVSDDGGGSFRSATRGEDVHVDHHSLWIDPNDGSTVVDGNDGGVYISQDRGETWRFVENLPLTQFYEISIDDATPYHVYGGLQDNGSWYGPGETWRGFGIRNYQWIYVGIGDGFTTTPDPNDDRYGWFAWQEGNLMRFDKETGYRRWTRPAPPSDSVDLRFNWNAPFEVSPHDGNTIYLGAQYLYRSTDDGMSWERISPDLTTDSAAWQQQTKSGGLTLDVTGAENYTTIYTVDESPVQQGVIWAGTDDGNLHVTRNGGESWTAVHMNMPDKPRHSWVSHVQASSHDAGTAYAAVHDYMRGDFTGTYVYRTTDYGESWTRLSTDGVDGFARVVLEDPENPSLLWVGTEFGLFYSLDRGQSWEEWTHGFPRGTPVRDLALQDQAHEQDLVVGSFGRGIYVIDDLTALRAVADDPSLLHADLHLFEPNPALQHQQGSATGYGNSGSTTYEGENEPRGVTLTIAAHVPDSLAEGGMEGEAPGDTARFPYTEVESAPDTTPPVPTKEATFQVLRGDSVIQESDLTLEEGLNRHTWDFETEGAGRFPRDMDELRQSLQSQEEDEELDGEGPAVLPGEFTARVVSHGDTATASLEVQGDPRVDTPMSDRRAKREMLLEVAQLQGAAASAVEAVRMARIRVNRALEVLSDQDGLSGSETDSLRQAGQTVIDSLKAVEEHWTGPLDSPQGISESETVLGEIGIAPFRFSSVAWYAPNEEERQRLEIARGAVSGAIERTNRVLETQVADFRDRVLDAGVELIPPVETVGMPSGGGGM